MARRNPVRSQTISSKMKSQNTRPRTTHRYNTDIDELSINRFERADYIYKVKSCHYRDELLQTDQKEEYLRAFPKSLRRYRYHSVISVKVEDLTSYEQNYRFLKKMKRKSDMNSDILLADCLEVYNLLPEGHQKDALYDLIGLVIQLKDTDVPRLRESECEKIFRRIQNLVNLINMTRRERITSIEFQLREDGEGDSKFKGNKMARRIKFLLARFEFIIATLGHFIHYNKLANTLQKKVHSRAINAKTINGAFTSVFTSMETKTKKDSDPQVRRKQSSNNNKAASRKESLEGPMIIERNQSYREEGDEALTESKFQQVKAYFKWKLEKWKDQDLEDIVLVCRICSKSMFAKIMKKHSPHCKKVAEEERIIKEFSKKISNTIHQVTKERHVVNVDLKIEKKQLTSLRAAQLEVSRELYQHNSEEEDSTDSMETTPKITRCRTLATFLKENEPLDNKYTVKVHNVKDDLKAFILNSKEELEEAKERERHAQKERTFPFEFVSADERESNNDSPTESPIFDSLQVPAELSRQSSRKTAKASMVRSRSQSRPEEEKTDLQAVLGEQETGLNSSFERFRKDKEEETEDIERLSNEVSLLGISKSKSYYTNKKFPELEISTNKEFLESPPNEAILDPIAADSKFGLRRSNTSQLIMGSPLLSATRRSSKKTDKSESPLPKRSSDTQTVNALRERLEKIKGIQALIKGYDAILHYANLVDNFNEFSSEARVVYEQARSEISIFFERVKNNAKFEEYTKEFLQILAEKLEQIKSIDTSKKELKLLELANIESSESNKEESGTNPQEAKSSYDSFEMVSTSEISPILPGRKSFGGAKTMIAEFDKKKLTITPDESPATRKRRKLKSKSVEKQSNNMRYELFEKSLQKIIKKNKKIKMEGTSLASPGKRSKFYRNSMFVSGFAEDPREEENEEDDDDTNNNNNFTEESKKPLGEKRSSRGSGTLMPQEIPEQDESSISEESSDSDETDKSESYKEEDLENDIDLNTQTNEKECFSDDESNLRRYAKKQEGFSSLITIEDFDFIKLISKGAYGRVWLVKRKITGDHYAMKIINFADRKNMNQIASLKTEKKVFEKLKGDFVVKAVFTFVHNSYLCIVMEFMIGGDFGHILEKFGALEEDDARFYIAEMVLALDNLHQLDIVHRDLKPDNILLNKNGHIKLTDFGLSEVGVQKHTKIKKAKRNSIFNSLTATKTTDKRLSLIIPTTTLPSKPAEKQNPNILKDEFSTIPEVDEEAPEIVPPQQTGNRVIGTPDYMAPEVINGTCYDDPCIDWWSVGVLLFEFLVGIPPFNDPDVDVVFENIVKRKIPWDELQIGYDEGCITPEAKDLIDSLLELDRTKRLGAKGAQEIKSHAFFKQINWDEILKSKAPIIPVTENDIDVSNFEKENKKFLQSELENPFHEKNDGSQSVSMINKENFELARVDILHEENEKVVQEATNTISQEELEKMRKARLVNRKWSVFD